MMKIENPQWIELSAELEATALKWWDLTRGLGQSGAVKWLSNDENGALVIVTRGEYREELMACVRSFDHIGNVDPADEVGRVWDVLHAAGINGAGGMTASEGVRTLIEKLRTTECQHDWFAPFGCRTMQCTKCDATRSAV